MTRASLVHEAGHPTLVLWDNPEGRVKVGREVGAGFRNGGDTVPVADSC